MDNENTITYQHYRLNSIEDQLLGLIRRDNKRLMYIDPVPCAWLRIEIFLTAVRASLSCLHGRNNGPSVVRVQIRTPEFGRVGGMFASRGMLTVHTRERHTSGRFLAACRRVAGSAQPAEERAKGDEATCCNPEARFDIRPYRYLSRCVFALISDTKPGKSG